MKKYLASALLIIASLSIHAEETRHADAHVHGLNHMQLILSQEHLSVTYEMPMVQLNTEGHEAHDDHHESEEHGVFAFLEGLFGHDEHDHEKEHDHDNDKHEEHKDHDHNQALAPDHLDEKMATLKDYQELFLLPAAADCHLEHFKSALHSVSSESTHKDIELSYQFECHDPKALTNVEISAFEHFELEQVIIEAMINNKAIFKTLKSDDRRLSL